jgi:hypothetical protein
MSRYWYLTNFIKIVCPGTIRSTMAVSQISGSRRAKAAGGKFNCHKLPFQFSLIIAVSNF